MAWCDRVDVTSSVVQMMSYICRVCCHTKSGCDALNTVGVMTQTSDSDVTGMVYILNCILDVVSYIKVVLS